MIASLAERLAAPARFDVVGLGEASLDDVWLLGEAPPWGGKARAFGREALGGGQVATALVACRRLGLRAAWLGKLGDDAAGRAILDGLAREGVDVSGAAVVAGAASHAAVILVDGAGERTVIFRDDERARLGASDVDVARASEGRVLHLDAADLDASIAAARAARAAGRVVTLDLDRLEPRTGELLALVDVCVASAEVHDALGLDGLHARGVAIACATRGAAGAVASDGKRRVEAVRRAPGRVVDTTACGDTFCAGLIAALLDDARDLAGCLAFAVAAAALKTRDLGRRGCPTRAEVDALVAAP
jgi:sugar/nucleoside kinase (ribokinase family)